MQTFDSMSLFPEGTNELQRVLDEGGKRSRLTLNEKYVPIHKKLIIKGTELCLILF